MRSSKSRSRSKSNRQRSIGNIINRVFDSSGPEGKVRGTPQQIIDKYLMLARDAQLSNDRVAEQNFLQHAEHYTRMLGEAQREQAREQEARQQQHNQGGGQQGGNANGTGSNGNGGQQGHQQNPQHGHRARKDADGSGDQPDVPNMMDAGDDEGSGLVETPEARNPRRERRAKPAPAAAETPGDAPEHQGAEQPDEKVARPRSRTPRKPRGPKTEGGDAAQADEKPAAE